MPRLKPSPAADSGVSEANRVVSYNLARARKSRGWTQDEFAEKLEPLLGYVMKKANVSAMERAAWSDRRRVFDAENLTAFALVFDLPISWFFIPSPEMCSGPVERMLAALVGSDDQQHLMRERFDEITERHPAPSGRSAEQASTVVAKHGWEQWSNVRAGWLEACVEQERHQLDDLFDTMEAFVETYKRLSVGEQVTHEAA